jgi:phosphoribosyl 1,2-cyclic phosphodiesterase
VRGDGALIDIGTGESSHRRRVQDLRRPCPTFPVPHDAVDPVGFAFYAGASGLGLITDLGYAIKMIVERLRSAHARGRD